MINNKRNNLWFNLVTPSRTDSIYMPLIKTAKKIESLQHQIDSFDILSLIKFIHLIRRTK